MPAPPDKPLLFTERYDEIGTRIVDLVNQVGFLYRFPELAGVTLACISQHLQPLQKLLADCADLREAFSQLDYRDGSTFGDHTAADPLQAAYDYSLAGFDAFLDAVRQHLDKSQPSDPSLANLRQALNRDCHPDPRKLLDLTETLDQLGPQVAPAASARFTPIPEVEWQKLRLVLVYFLLDLQHAPQNGGNA